jgi:ABC-type transport system involved in cytochrome bd biosynthesis fused ATPase/permease subunit
MEFLLQYLDDLDDLYGAFGLVWERLRRALLRLLSIAMISTVAVAAIGLALLHPPIALATSTMLFVILLYRSVTVPSKKWASVA